MFISESGLLTGRIKDYSDKPVPKDEAVRRDIHGYIDPITRMVPARTKDQWPYSYDAFILWEHLEEGKSVTNTFYTDRLLTWDRTKHDRISQKIWGDKAQTRWGERTSETIAQFVKEYFDVKGEVTIMRLDQCCNVSSGYTIWIINYHVEPPKTDEEETEDR